MVNLELSSTDTPVHWDKFGRIKLGLGYSISVLMLDTGVEQEDPFLELLPDEKPPNLSLKVAWSGSLCESALLLLVEGFLSLGEPWPLFCELPDDPSSLLPPPSFPLSLDISFGNCSANSI